MKKNLYFILVVSFLLTMLAKAQQVTLELSHSFISVTDNSMWNQPDFLYGKIRFRVVNDLSDDLFFYDKVAPSGLYHAGFGWQVMRNSIPVNPLDLPIASVSITSISEVDIFNDQFYQITEGDTAIFELNFQIQPSISGNYSFGLDQIEFSTSGQNALNAFFETQDAPSNLTTPQLYANAPVPEPSVAVLGGLGIFCLIQRRRR